MRAAGQGADQPEPYRVGEGVQSQADGLQRDGAALLGPAAAGVLDHGLPSRCVHHDQVGVAVERGEEGDAGRPGLGGAVLELVQDQRTAPRLPR
ncbi:hypothetical protein GCM10020229_81140 [Kitasatospora albolonga]